MVSYWDIVISCKLGDMKKKRIYETHFSVDYRSLNAEVLKTFFNPAKIKGTPFYFIYPLAAQNQILIIEIDMLLAPYPFTPFAYRPCQPKEQIAEEICIFIVFSKE